MKQFVTTEYERLQEGMEDVTLTSMDSLQKAERCCLLVRQSLENLREFILSHPFQDEAEEINFFKATKPLFLRELIYYTEVFYAESGKPIGDKEVMAAYFKQITERIRLFFYRNQAFYVYYRTGKTHKDAAYFLRKTDSPQSAPVEYLPEMDPRCCTVYSYKLGKLLAYEQLGAYLENALSLLEQSPSLEPAERSASRPLTWTGSKAQFIELAYALQSFGAFNKGKVNVKQVIQYLEYCFNITTTNYYGAFQTMRIRKKNRAMFLDTLKDYLIRRMDESDEFPRMS